MSDSTKTPHSRTTGKDGTHYGHSTIARSAGISEDTNFGAIMPPLYLSSTHRFDALDWEGIVSGGDDYKLLLAVPDDRLEVMMRALEGHGLTLAAISRFTDSDNQDPAVRIYDESGTALPLAQTGWRHF